MVGVSSTCVTSVSADCVDSSITLSSNVLLESKDYAISSILFPSSSVLPESASDAGRVMWIGVTSADAETSTTFFVRLQTFRKGARKASLMFDCASLISGSVGVVDLAASEDISDLRLDIRRPSVSVGSDCARGLVEEPSPLDSVSCILPLRENGSFVANSLRVEIPAAIENLRRALLPSFSTEFICSS